MKMELRISAPNLKVDTFEKVLLYILNRCADKENVGKTVLNKLLYFCDFNFYELYEEQLTGATYKKMQYGPVPQELEEIADKMIAKGLIQKKEGFVGNFPQTRYLPTRELNSTALSAVEKAVIDEVLTKMGDWTAYEISEYSHGDMPWLATNDRDFIDYNLAFYREAPYSVRTYEDEL